MLFWRNPRINGSLFNGRQTILEKLEQRRLLSVSPAALSVGLPAPSAGATHDSQVKVHGINISAEAGDAFSGQVASVSGLSNVGDVLARLNATINWGDGTQASQGVLGPGANGTITITGDHTYAAGGKFKMSVTLTQSPTVIKGQPNPPLEVVIGTGHGTANVSDAEGGLTLTETATQKFRAKLGSFDFANVDMAVTITIDWGDGAKSTGEAIKTSTDDYDVFGSHTYAQTGTFKVHVTAKASQIGAPALSSVVAQFVASIHVMGHA